MAEKKTQATNVDPHGFIAALEHDTRRGDAETMLATMERLSGYKAKMWGPSIIGFGRYHYVYDSGREGDSMVVGFSPRKANIVVYLMPGYENLTDQLERLGKHKIGKSCLYINKLTDVDADVLEEMITMTIAHMRESYDTFPD